jgi:hypothetical protein
MDYVLLILTLCFVSTALMFVLAVRRIGELKERLEDVQNGYVVMSRRLSEAKKSEEYYWTYYQHRMEELREVEARLEATEVREREAIADCIRLAAQLKEKS